MKITITENKSVGKLAPGSGLVRTFVGDDFHYGYFVPEQKVFALLNKEQQRGYLQDTAARLDVSPEVAQQIIGLAQR